MPPLCVGGKPGWPSSSGRKAQQRPRLVRYRRHAGVACAVGGAAAGWAWGTAGGSRASNAWRRRDPPATAARPQHEHSVAAALTACAGTAGTSRTSPGGCARAGRCPPAACTRGRGWWGRGASAGSEGRLYNPGCAVLEMQRRHPVGPATKTNVAEAGTQAKGVPAHSDLMRGQGSVGGRPPPSPGLPLRLRLRRLGSAAGASQAGGKAGPLSWLRASDRVSACVRGGRRGKREGVSAGVRQRGGG
jgi:hypothetical protein